ncbi:MAG: PAS domain-containing sensor histidine kinase, partial [Bacteroidota bacterium]
SNDGLWDWDFNKGEVFASDPWKTMLGLSTSVNVDMDLWSNLLHPEDRERSVRYFYDFVDGKTYTYHQEFRLKHTDGSFRWISSKAKAVRNENKKAIRVSGSHTDITDRKIAENRLKKSEEKYRNLFQNSVIAMFRSNAETGEIIEGNDKLWQLLKLTDQDTRFQFDFFKDSKEKRRVLELIQIQGAVENVELKITNAEAETVWVSFSGVLYKEENTMECILKDITETKENLLELQKVNFELDSFVYHASHDLRSPLRSILGLIDIYRLEEDKKIKGECIEKIESSVKRLDNLVVELLSISRNDRINDPHQCINLMSEINYSISSYFNASDTTGLEIRSKILEPVKFYSDPTRVRIILNNLISNAIKYRSFHKERNFIYIEAIVYMDKMVLKVVDNGEGIEESKLPNIFDMFYRATEKSEGSGLGLYIVKKVADKLNAKIEVQSEELEGTTLVVTIPNTLLKKEK